MNRTEFTARVAKRLDIPPAQVKRILDGILEELADALVAGERVSLTGFGSFFRTWYPPRRGRHPRTGRLLELHPRYAVRFHVGAPLQKRLRDLIPTFDEDPLHIKARRVARTLVADLRLYHQSLIDEAIKQGFPGEELVELLQEVRERFEERVPAELSEVRNYLEEELAAAFGNRQAPETRPRAAGTPAKEETAG